MNCFYLQNKKWVEVKKINVKSQKLLSLLRNKQQHKDRTSYMIVCKEFS